MQNKPLNSSISGIVLVNKPKGLSSNAVANIVKHQIGAKKAGHLGTLDLEGEGLLPVTINSATKLFDYYLNKTKTYETVFVFGYETDTLDTSGKIIKQKDCDVSSDDVEKAIKTMIGKSLQMPPQYSAKKVNGKIAYKEARKGKAVELKPKEIEIFDFKLLGKEDKNVFKFSITCSSGTYIRSICRDLAEKLSTYGSMQRIIRTRCGGFDLKDAFTIEDIKNGEFQILSCETVFDYEKLKLSDCEVKKLLNGQTISFLSKNGCYRIYDSEKFVGIGKVDNNALKLIMRF